MKIRKTGKQFYLTTLSGSVIKLTHWGRVTHICVSKQTFIGSDNGLSPGRRKAIIWTNVEILLIGPLGTNFSENLIKLLTFAFTKMRLKVSSAKWRPFCLGLSVLIKAVDVGTWVNWCIKTHENGEIAFLCGFLRCGHLHVWSWCITLHWSMTEITRTQQQNHTLHTFS